MNKKQQWVLDHPILFAFGLMWLGCLLPFVAGAMTYAVATAMAML
jgi:hypothetical protein